MKTQQWVAWGINLSYVPCAIKLTGGTLAHCRDEVRFRQRGTGWLGLTIYKEGTLYPKDVEAYLLRQARTAVQVTA